jgi:hypothetical protein
MSLPRAAFAFHSIPSHSIRGLASAEEYTSECPLEAGNELLHTQSTIQSGILLTKIICWMLDAV